MYTTFTSRNRHIAEQLSKKLQLTASQLKQQPETSPLDFKYKQVAEKLKIFKTKNQRYQLQIGQDMQRVEDILFAIQRSKNKNNDLITQLSENLQKLIQSEQSGNTEKMTAVRKGMIQDLQKKKKTMKTDAIQIIQQEFEELCKTNLAQVEKKTSALMSMLQEQRSCKQESASFLAESMGEEILKLEQGIGQERQERRRQNESLLELIGEMQGKFENEIKEEVRLREKSQQYIESRLQEICFKIQHKILGN